MHLAKETPERRKKKKEVVIYKHIPVVIVMLLECNFKLALRGW
jgi:hypothetical protein